MEDYNWCLRWGVQKGCWRHKDICEQKCTEAKKNKCVSYRESIGKPIKKYGTKRERALKKAKKKVRRKK